MKSYKTTPFHFILNHQENANNDITLFFFHPLNTSGFTDRTKATCIIQHTEKHVGSAFFLFSEDISLNGTEMLQSVHIPSLFTG